MPEIIIDTKVKCIDFELYDVDVESGHFALTFEEFFDLVKEVIGIIKNTKSVSEQIKEIHKFY
jgi:hypothetical protein